VSRDASLSGFIAGQGDAKMNNKVSLNTAILSFAFSGVFAPHKRGSYEAPRPTPSAKPKAK
jgi:hypothetical protein